MDKISTNSNIMRIFEKKEKILDKTIEFYFDLLSNIIILLYKKYNYI